MISLPSRNSSRTRGLPWVLRVALGLALLVHGPAAAHALQSGTSRAQSATGGVLEPRPELRDEGAWSERLPLDLDEAPSGFWHRVTTRDDRVLFGWIASRGDPVRIALADGSVVEISRADIAGMDRVRGTMVGGEFWVQDPNHSRLIFAPTARNLPAGSGSFNAYYGAVPFVAVGLTDRFTLAGGTALLRGTSFDLFPRGSMLQPEGDEEHVGEGRVVHLAPKLQVMYTRRVQVAVGGLAFVHPADLSVSTGIGYAVVTFSPTERTGLTAGAGLGVVQGAWNGSPAWLAGGDWRVKRRLKVLAEGYRFPDGSGVGAAGVRLVGEHASLDLAVAVRPESPTRPVIPVMNVSLGWSTR